MSSSGSLEWLYQADKEKSIMREVYRKKFIENCLKICSDDEYADKIRVRQHNRAMTVLEELYHTMFEHEDHCEALAMELLHHEDEKVRLGAGAYCLKAGIHNDLALQVLTHLQNTSTDKMLSASAACTIMFCKSFAQQ